MIIKTDTQRTVGLAHREVIYHRRSTKIFAQHQALWNAPLTFKFSTLTTVLTLT